MRSKGLRVAALLAIVAMLAAACGSDRKDDNASGGGDTSTTKPESGGSKTFGDLPSPCGEGSAKGATDQGVTDDSITIGYGDDAGYPQSPGLNHEMSDAMKAMLKWCNDQGGINGRQVKGNYYDAKITEVNNVMTEACAQVFFLVGEGWAFDSGQEQIRMGCKLPAVPTYSVSPEFANAPLMYQPVPNPVDFQPVTDATVFKSKFPDKIAKTAAMYANYAATRDTTEKRYSTMGQLGYKFLPCPQEYNIAGEADWKPFAQKLKDCGAEVVYWSGSPFPNFENFLQAADQLGFKPAYLLEANFYDESLRKWNKEGLADNIYVRSQDVPTQFADKNKATKDYVDIVNATGGDTSSLGIHAASAFLLWATQVKACGSTVTRQCVLDKLAAVHKWTGGGLSGEADPGNNMPSACEVVVQLKATEWVQIAPKTQGEYDCNPDNVKKVSGNVVDKVQLGPDRKVHKYEVK